MRFSLFITLLLVVTGCGGGGPSAPPIDALTTSCTPSFCLEHPSSWTVEAGDTFLSLRDGEARASVAFVNMEAIASNASLSLPARPDDVVRAFWALLSDGQQASLAKVTFAGDVVLSEGTLEGVRLWHGLIPIDAVQAVGVEVRGPNQSWAAHADVIRLGVTLQP